VHSLACVFLEMSTVIMGETMSTQRKHLVCGEQHIEGWKQYQVDYDESLNNGHIESWISHLKTEFAAMSPETSVYKCFSSPAALAKYTTVDNAVAAFFDNIMMMFRADLGARGVLDEAWECFSCFCQNNCEHCYAQVSVRQMLGSSDNQCSQ